MEFNVAELLLMSVKYWMLEMVELSVRAFRSCPLAYRPRWVSCWAGGSLPQGVSVTHEFPSLGSAIPDACIIVCNQSPGTRATRRRRQSTKDSLQAPCLCL